MSFQKESSDDEMEEDEAEWQNSFEDSLPVSVAAADAGTGTGRTAEPAHRVVLHFDLDCFYAQVEMIRNPALRSVPLGIQQKYIIVTCNYVAREQGVTKLMSVTAALEKCPGLVLVRGEDLTHYRDMSYKVTELLASFSPLVERLGFDENFVDVTEMVERRLARAVESDGFSFKGHVYDHVGVDVKASHHPRLALGSHIAAELRGAMRSRLGLTGCAGIATSKLLAKLVSGAFKPNQQTVLLPESTGHIMSSLSGLRKVPGVGHQTAKRLQALGLVSVKDLQLCPLGDLVKEFGGPSAQRLKNLALGVDDSPVTSTGAPQSLSDEDSFKKMSSTGEVSEKIQQLLSSLVERMHKDGRQPQTFRLTIRKYSATNKWFNRESRQCPVPKHIGQKIVSGCGDEAMDQLLPLATKLFQKMVGGGAFHLTLINVCFSNLQSRAAAVSGKGAITSFFTHGASPRKTQVEDEGASSQAGDRHQFSIRAANAPHKQQLAKKNASHPEASFAGFDREQSFVVGEEEALKAPCSTAARNLDGTSDPTPHQLPPSVDPEVFKLLPEEIQKELLSPAYVNSLSRNSANKSESDVARRSETGSSQNFTASQTLINVKEAPNKSDVSGSGTTVNHRPSSALPEGKVAAEAIRTLPQPPDCDFPGNVDPAVFSELPPDVQRELMSEWKLRRATLKTPSSRKSGKSPAGKDRKAAGKGGQANSLFKYFKPR